MKPKNSILLFLYFLFITGYLLEIEIVKAIIISLSGTVTLFLIRNLPNKAKEIAYASYGLVFISTMWFSLKHFDKIFNLFNFYL